MQHFRRHAPRSPQSQAIWASLRWNTSAERYAHQLEAEVERRNSGLTQAQESAELALATLQQAQHQLV